MRTACPTALALVVGVTAGCQSTERFTTDCGDVIVVEGEYTVVLFSPAVLGAEFGPEWTRQQLFYKADKVRLEDGVGRVAGPMLPMAAGTPVIVCPGSKWNDLRILVYSMDSDIGGWFVLDTQAGRFEREGRSRKLERRPVLLKDGTLYIGQPR